MPRAKTAEHRQHPRTKINVAVELQFEKTSQPLRVKTADLSIGGLYIEMMFTLEVGTKLNIVLWINNVKVTLYDGLGHLPSQPQAVLGERSRNTALTGAAARMSKQAHEVRDNSGGQPKSICMPTLLYLQTIQHSLVCGSQLRRDRRDAEAPRPRARSRKRGR